MGMAASQARLLCLTARIHDVEYQAQAIQHAKVQLATQSDQIYQDYLAALDATTMTINTMDESGEKSIIAATFNNMFSRNKVRAADGTNYALRNSQGLLVVEDEIEEGYYNFTKAGYNDPYQFAMFMIDGGQDIGNIDPNNNDFGNTLEDAEKTVYENLDDNLKDDKTTLGKLHRKLEELVGSSDIYDADAYNTNVASDPEKVKEYEETLAQYRKQLYQAHSGEIYVNAPGKGSDYNIEEDFNNPLFNYYVSIFNQIRSCGGCVSIDEYDGPDGDAANNSAWLQSMVQSGQFSIDIIKTDSKTGDVSLNATSPGSDTCLAYTQTSTIDNRALAKAEAEYEHKMKQIDKKDQMFDMDLSKLETERTALTTEYESVKKVIEDNIDRTFGIFS